MQYLFEDGNEVPVILPPHGNAKRSSTSHRRTQSSTLKMIKESKAKPKIVVSEVCKEMGGSIEAGSASELPRNRRQVYNARQQSSTSSATDSTASGSTRSDPIFELIKQCKEDMLPNGRKFVRSVSIDPTPSCILASESQLKDLKRFCTDPAESCVLGVDSTFDLGKFYVTITTYRYLHVENKNSGKPPVFFGPIYVHTEKTYEAFYHFFSSLLKLEPSLNDLIAIGTDGDPAMEKAIGAVFPESLIHLRCFIHMKDNIRRKLTELLLPQSVREDIIRDIFGVQHGSTYTQGILDAEDSADFDGRLASLQKKWEELEMTAHPCKQPRFYDWILRYEAGVMKSSMIAPVRTSAGLGYPPAKYTTNDNECLNNIAQAHADYRRCSWIEFNNNMYDLVTLQSKEVEKAVYGMGEYKFCSKYDFLQIDSTQWFLKTSEQRQKHLKAVFETCASHPSVIHHTTTTRAASLSRLSVPVEKTEITTLPAGVLNNIWSKADRILQTPNSICDAPGMSNAKCVASESGGKPHIISKNKKGTLSCDDACIGWKSQRICSHVVAAAESMGLLNSFVASYRKAKVQSNYTAVVTHNLPKGIGSKPGKQQKRKAPANVQKPEVDSVVNPFPAQNLATTSESDTGQLETTELSSLNIVTSNQVQQLNIQPQYLSSSLQICSGSIPTTTSTGPHVSVCVTTSCADLPTEKLVVSMPNLSFVPPRSQPTSIAHASFTPQLNDRLPVVNASSFQVKFLTASIKVCAGCRNGYQRGLDGKGLPSPPYDLCLVRKEQHLFYNVVTGRQQLSALKNVHYHPNLTCPKARCPSFDSSQVQIPNEVREKLLPEHWLFLLHTYGCV